MFKLRPSAKEKKRYLLINGKREDIEKAILDYVGVLGWAKAMPHFLKNKGKHIVLSISRKEIDKIRGAFALSADKMEVLRVSGTLKKLFEGLR